MEVRRKSLCFPRATPEDPASPKVLKNNSIRLHALPCIDKPSTKCTVYVLFLKELMASLWKNETWSAFILWWNCHCYSQRDLQRKKAHFLPEDWRPQFSFAKHSLKPYLFQRHLVKNGLIHSKHLFVWQYIVNALVKGLMTSMSKKKHIHVKLQKKGLKVDTVIEA